MKYREKFSNWFTPGAYQPFSRKRKMNAEERRRLIVEYLAQRELATNEELSQRFQISPATLHRDLTLLANEGLLRKTRGGATVRPNRIFETALAFRAQEFTVEKRRIAQYALRFMSNKRSLLFDNSTTALALALLLDSFQDLTVITYFEEIIRALSQPGYQTKVVSTGGELNKTHQTLTGPLVESCLGQLRVDGAFISAPAVQPGLGIMHQYADESRRKRLIMAASDEVTLLVDRSKFEKTALHIVAPLNQVARVITDGPLPPHTEEAIRAQGVELHVVTTLSPYAAQAPTDQFDAAKELRSRQYAWAGPDEEAT